MTTRRKLLITLGATALAPRTVLAQSKQAPVVIGWLHPGSRSTEGQMLDAFKEGLAALGWKERSNYVLEERWADTRLAQLQSMAEELTAKKPAVIVASAARSVAAAAKAAPDTPIVHTTGDMVVTGLVKNLARPGGMITGVTTIGTQLIDKVHELLREAVPGLKRVGFLVDTTLLNHPAVIEAVRRSMARDSANTRFAEAAGSEEIDQAIARLAKEDVQMLVVTPSANFLTARERVVKLSQARRWPVASDTREYVEAGALLSYGTDRLAHFRRAAYYVDKILKGAKPGDLPIEQPTKFELVINMKTAKTLGIAIPQPFLMRADRVIE